MSGTGMGKTSESADLESYLLSWSTGFTISLYCVSLYTIILKTHCGVIANYQEVDYQVYIEESLDNAKVSERQPWYYCRTQLTKSPLTGTLSNINVVVEKYFQCTTIPSPTTMQAYLHLLGRCCLPKIRSSTKFKEHSVLIAVQGHPRSMILVPIESCICHFLLVINSNFGPILHRFWDRATYW